MRVLERSIFSDRMVFVRAMHEAGHMGDLELSVYDSW
jgi:deoxyadenosine/deoxycytidine kinase